MKNLAFIFIFAFFLQSCVVRPRPVVHHNHNKVVYVKAPRHHKIVVVKGKKYHYWHGKYHRKTNKGYVVVTVR